MEEEFSKFFLSGLFFIFPFVFAYLSLYVLDWNDRKNLLADSWYVFLAWLLSSFSVYFVFIFLDHKFYFDGSNFSFSVIFIITFFIANICAIAGTLYLTSNAKRAAEVTNYFNIENAKPNLRNIWQTSLLTSLLMAMITAGFISAINDLSRKLTPQAPQATPQQSSKGEGVHFEVYD